MAIEPVVDGTKSIGDHLSAGGAKDKLRRVLASPIAGFAPWIAFSVLEGPKLYELAIGAALGIAVLELVVGMVVGARPKQLDIAAIVFFVGMLIAGVLVGPEGQTWLDRWSGEVSNAMLVFVALGSIAFRVPFTIQYAREMTPHEYWDTRQVPSHQLCAHMGVDRDVCRHGNRRMVRRRSAEPTGQHLDELDHPDCLAHLRHPLHRLVPGRRSRPCLADLRTLWRERARLDRQPLPTAGRLPCPHRHCPTGAGCFADVVRRRLDRDRSSACRLPTEENATQIVFQRLCRASQLNSGIGHRRGQHVRGPFRGPRATPKWPAIGSHLDPNWDRSRTDRARNVSRHGSAGA